MHSKSDIKKWLKENGKDCDWLAEQCGVSIHTVYGWMSSRRSIPAKSRVRIGELMGEVKQPLGVIRGVQAGSFEALQLENCFYSWKDNSGRIHNTLRWIGGPVKKQHSGVRKQTSSGVTRISYPPRKRV